MKIRATITEVSVDGAELRFIAEGNEVGESEFASPHRIGCRVSNRAGRARALYVGREITIEIKAVQQ